MTLTFLVFIFVVSILVLVHELGHFLAAKKFGIKVEEFGVGIPPRIIGVERGETVYSINWLPFGGFVKLFGEEREETTDFQLKAKNYKRAFFARPIRQRAVVLLAGVGMNFLLSVAVISFLFTQGVLVPTDKVKIERVEEGSPAHKAGLKVGDRVLTIEGKEVKQAHELIEITKTYLGQKVTLKIEGERREKIEVSYQVVKGDTLWEIAGRFYDEPRLWPKIAQKNLLRKSGLIKPGTILVIPDKFEETPPVRKILEILIIPRVKYPEGQGPMGIAISNFEERIYPWYKAPFLGTYEAFRLSFILVKGIGETLWKLITFKPIKEEVAGPVGIAELTGKAVRFGKMAVLELLGLLSLNLAVVNVLPFPALDGGRLLFVGIEAATGKKIKARWEKITHQIGMAILLALIILVTINDILRILR